MAIKLNNLTPKNLTDDGWVSLPDNQRIRVDYPTRAQERLLNGLLVDSMVNNADGTISTLKSAKLKYMEMYLKFTIKDLENFGTECIIVNNELGNSIWDELTSDMVVVAFLFSAIDEVLKWDEVDKKK